jgi:hypothetical protein
MTMGALVMKGAGDVGDAEYVEDLLRTAFDQVREGVQMVRENFESLITVVNQAIDFLNRIGLIPGWPFLVSHWLKHNLEGTLGRIQVTVIEAINKAEEALEHSTPIISLIISSFRWITEVQTPLSDLSSVVSSPRDQNMYSWSGAAASAYHDKVSAQQGAVDQSMNLAAQMSNWLIDIAMSNVDYAVELAKMLSDLAGKLIVAVGEAATVAGVPWALEQASEALSEVLASGLKILVEVGLRLVEAVGNIQDLQSQAGDHSALPGGRWPQAVAG